MRCHGAAGGAAIEVVTEADVDENDGALDAVPEIPIADCERLLKVANCRTLLPLSAAPSSGARQPPMTDRTCPRSETDRDAETYSLPLGAALRMRSQGRRRKIASLLGLSTPSQAEGRGFESRFPLQES
jgi:hypothetical protein